MLRSFRLASVALALGIAISYASAADGPAPAKDRAAQAAAEKQEAKRGRDAKPNDLAGKVESQLQKMFKIWDRSRDGAVDMAELEKSYAKLKVKPGQDDANAPNPFAPVAAMHAKIDGDKDGSLSKSEFDAWAADFSAHLAEYAYTQQELARVQRKMADLQALANKNRGISAADGIFQQEAQRGLIQYKQIIAELETKLDELKDKGGHSEYRDFLMQQLAQQIKR